MIEQFHHSFFRKNIIQITYLFHNTHSSIDRRKHHLLTANDWTSIGLQITCKEGVGSGVVFKRSPKCDIARERKEYLNSSTSMPINLETQEQRGFLQLTGLQIMFLCDSIHGQLGKLSHQSTSRAIEQHCVQGNLCGEQKEIDKHTCLGVRVSISQALGLSNERR